MTGVTPNGIRYPDGASKAKDLGHELQTMAEDIDQFVDTQLDASSDRFKQEAEEAVATALPAELAKIPVVRNDPQPASDKDLFFNTPAGDRTWLGFSNLIDPETRRVRPPRETADDLRVAGGYVHDDGAGTGVRAANGARLWIDWETLVDPVLKVVPPTLLAKVAAGGTIFGPVDPSPYVPAGAYFTWFDTSARTFNVMMGDAA
jgi:hypothetical protein